MGAAPSLPLLIAGIGNIFLGDDAFGIEVVRRLAVGALPAGVRLLEIGTKSLYLAYELADGGYGTVILVDAMSRGGAPGTLYVVEPYELASDTALVDPHGIRPEEIVETARRLGGTVGRVLVIGCEPARLDGDGLSDPVTRAVEEAVRIVRGLAAEATPAHPD